MNYIQLHFKHRPRWIEIPVDDDEFLRTRRFFHDRHEDVGFFHISTYYDQRVRVNGGNLTLIRFLEEPRMAPEVRVGEIQPSVQDTFIGETDVDLDAVRWEWR